MALDVTLAKVKRIQIQMMRDRGYKIEGEEDDFYRRSDQYIVDYYEGLREDDEPVEYLLSQTYEVSEDAYPDTPSPVLIQYIADSKDNNNVPKPAIRLFAVKIEEEGYKLGILITKLILPKDIREIIESNVHHSIQHFLYQDLIFNVTLHVQVPAYERLTMEERIEVLEESSAEIRRIHKAYPDLTSVPSIEALYKREVNLRLSRLPILVHNDPVARYYYWKPGTLVRAELNDDVLPLIAPVKYVILVVK